jgi:flagellar biogenesis protein FliO
MPSIFYFFLFLKKAGGGAKTLGHKENARFIFNKLFFVVFFICFIYFLFFIFKKGRGKWLMPGDFLFIV